MNGQHKDCLALYYNLCIKEWINRGYRNTMEFLEVGENIEYPEWLGNKDFHDSHKSNLLRKFPEHYKKFHWKVSDDLPYIWPVRKEKIECLNQS